MLWTTVRGQRSFSSLSTSWQRRQASFSAQILRLPASGMQLRIVYGGSCRVA